MSSRIDPFLSQENHNHLLNEYSKIFSLANEKDVNNASVILQNLMVDVRENAHHKVVHMPELQRLKRLNEYIIARLLHKHKSHKTIMTSAFTRARVSGSDAPVIGPGIGTGGPSDTIDGIPNPLNPNRRYRYDEKMIIINAANRDWASSEGNAYEFSIRFNPSVTHRGLSIDDSSINNCTAIKPIALFIPKEPVVDEIENAPYLVLDSDAESNNVITSTQRNLNGENVALTITDSDSKTHYKYINVGDTLLKPTAAVQTLSSLNLKIRLPNGTELNNYNNVIHKNTGYTSAEKEAGAVVKLKYKDASDWHIFMTELPPLDNSDNYEFDFEVNGNALQAGMTFSDFRLSGDLSVLASDATNAASAINAAAALNVGSKFTNLTDVKSNTSLPVSKFTSNEYVAIQFPSAVTTVAGKLVTQGPATTTSGGNTITHREHYTATGYVVSDVTAGNVVIVAVSPGDIFDTFKPVNIVDVATASNNLTPTSVTDPYTTIDLNWISLRDTNAAAPHLLLKTFTEVLIS